MVILAVLGLTNAFVYYWVRKPEPLRVELKPEPQTNTQYELRFEPFLNKPEAEYFPDIRQSGVKVNLLFHNDSVPGLEIHNIMGEAWAQTTYLIGVFKQKDVLYFERRDRGRITFALKFPILHMMTPVWLPSWIFKLPPAGEAAVFGAQVVSTEVFYRQFIWTLKNENGRPKISGGDATPEGVRTPYGTR